MSLRAASAQLAWLAASLPAHRRFSQALRAPAAAQESWLRRHLARHSRSDFARQHGGPEIRSYQDFARRFPVIGYDDLNPWIERVRRGEANVLTVEPVTRLLPTSGSTGARKLIPYTRSFQHELNAAIGPWWVDLCRQTPTLPLGSAYWSVSPLAASETASDSRVPIGFDDDRDYLGGARAWLIDAALAVPSTVRHLTDLRTFRHVVLRHLLARADLRFISIWHPSFLTLLLDTLAQEWDDVLARATPALPANRRRELARLGPSPRAIWPHLRVISCWADGSASAPAAGLAARFPGVHVQPKGLLATEAFVTLPFQGRHPVAVHSHLFEFADARGAVFPLEGIRPGETYEVIVTTGGGLWRYRLGDWVEVTGFAERMPTLRFLGRGCAVSDCCGEKLSERFVADVLRQRCPAAPFALLAPEAHEGGWRYVLYLEGGATADLPTRLDQALRANPHYALAQDLGQLGTVRVCPVARDGFSRFAAAECSRGRRLGDVKPVALSARTDWAAWFVPSGMDSAPRLPASSH